MDSCGSTADSSSEATSWEDSESLSDVDSVSIAPHCGARSHAVAGPSKHSRRNHTSKQQVLARLLQTLLNNKGRRKDNNGTSSSRSHEQRRVADAQAANSAVQQTALNYAHQIQQEFQAATDSYHNFRLTALRNRLSHVRTKKATQLLHHKHAAAVAHKSPSSGHGHPAPIEHSKQKQQKHATAAGAPSLPALAVIVKLLLQLAAATTTPSVASQLRLQFLQQVKAAIVAAKHQQNATTVAAAVHAALPGLRAAVKEACRTAQQQQQLQMSDAPAVKVFDQGLQHQQQGSPSAATAVTLQLPTSNGVLNPARALEAALTTAACEVQLLGLHISPDADSITNMQQAVMHDNRGSSRMNSHNGLSSKQLNLSMDMESLLHGELSLAMADEMPAAGRVTCG